MITLLLNEVKFIWLLVLKQSLSFF